MENTFDQHPNGITLHGIYFNEISYRNLIPFGIPEDDVKKGEFQLRISRSCVCTGGDRFIVYLRLSGYAKEAFNFVVECSGEFTVPKDLAKQCNRDITQKDILGTSCISILFPFAREKAMWLINDSGYHDIMIQPFSVQDFFKDKPEMEICYMEKPISESPDSTIDSFLDELSVDSNSGSSSESEVRDESIHAICDVKEHIRKRKLDGNIVLSKEGFDILSSKLYRILNSHGMMSSVDDKVGYPVINLILERLHIQIEVVLFNDSENNYEPAYVIYKKRKDGQSDE